MSIARTEWLKISRYPAFWWVMLLTALSYPGINYGFLFIYNHLAENKNSPAAKVAKMLMGNPFGFPEVWRTVAYGTSLFLVIPSIVVIMLITNEYNYKTNRQNIIDGWSRRDFMVGKLIDVLILSCLLTTLYTIVVLLIGFPHTDAGVIAPWSLAYYIGLFALQTFSQLSLAFLVGLLVKKSFIALSIFTFYFVIFEPMAVRILKYKFNNDIGRFFPLEISQKILPAPAFFGKFDPEAYKLSLAMVPAAYDLHDNSHYRGVGDLFPDLPATRSLMPGPIQPAQLSLII